MSYWARAREEMAAVILEKYPNGRARDKSPTQAMEKAAKSILKKNGSPDPETKITSLIASASDLAGKLKKPDDKPTP